jgi:ABC-type Fe3+-siderophore transport system permease subunit
MRWALVAVSVALVGLAPWLGPAIPEGAESFVFWQLRIPRVLVAAAAGCVLGAVGAAFQALFENPLATPSTTGTTAGAALGALGAILFLPGPWSVVLCAFAGALAISLPVAGWAARPEARTEDILLAGVALTLAAGAIASGLQVTADASEALRAVRWSLGSVGQVGYQGAALLGPVATLVVLVVWRQTRGLQALIAGEARAASQGVDVPRLRVQVLLVGCLGVASVVAWCGPIAFVGLVVPHAVRRLVGAGRQDLFWLSAVCGAAFLVGADVLARLLLPGRELPVGVITAAVGAPLLVTLVLRPQR